jgi:hypothetical protein
MCRLVPDGEGLDGGREGASAMEGERAFYSPLYFSLLVDITSDNLIWSIKVVSVGTFHAGLLGQIFPDLAG